MKPDSHALDAPVHYVRDYKNIKLACRPNEAPPHQYRASADPDIVTCPGCQDALLVEIQREARKFKPKCACGRDDCVGDCPQSDMAFDTAREDRFFR